MALARPARAADVVYLGGQQRALMNTTTMRVPGTGNFTAAGSQAGYLTVQIALSSIDYKVARVTFLASSSVFSTALGFQVGRDGDVNTLRCRSEIWGAQLPTLAGSVEIVVEPVSGNPMPPTMSVTLAAFANVASTSTDGTCCANASNAGGNTSTINKTMFGSSRGDHYVNTVCTAWQLPATGGSPTPDPAMNPEMVLRSNLVIGADFALVLQHFTGTSPGADVVKPATSYRHLRWLQSGSRTWAIAGLMLQATDSSTPPLDAGPPPVDMGMPPMMDALVDLRPTPAPDAPAMEMAPPTPDAASPDTASPPDVNASGPEVAPGGGGSSGSGGAAAPLPGADASFRVVDYRIGCACDLGAQSRGGAGVALLTILLLALVGRARRAR